LTLQVDHPSLNGEGNVTYGNCNIHKKPTMEHQQHHTRRSVMNVESDFVMILDDVGLNYTPLRHTIGTNQSRRFNRLPPYGTGQRGSGQ
jgi:hypothetical protein